MGRGDQLGDSPMSRFDVLHMIKRRAAAAALPYSTCCHTFRATGITSYLENGGTLEHAQAYRRRVRHCSNDSGCDPVVLVVVLEILQLSRLPSDSRRPVIIPQERPAGIRENRRRRRPVARYASDTRQTVTSPIRKWDAVEAESPTPVPSAIYAAMHTGHFGNSASTVPGIAHRASSKQRRTNRGRLGSVGRPATSPRSLSVGAAAQQ
jgi:hypothetical protein